MDVYCRECERLTEVVLDHSKGATFCSRCGFVLHSHSFNETSPECTSFPDEEFSNTDQNLVDRTENPVLINNDELSTFVADSNGTESVFVNPGVGCSNSIELHLVSDFMTIADMSERLGLGATIKDRAYEIYRKVEDKKLGRGRNHKAMLAACLYIACRQEDTPHTVKEICSVSNGATRKEIGRASVYTVKELKHELGESVHIKIIHASDFMNRFCKNLGIANKIVKAAIEAAQNAEGFDIRKNPITIAATVIYTVTQLSDDKKTLKDITVVTGVSEATIRSCYKEMCPHLAQIIPNWYVQAEDPFKYLKRP